MKGLGDKFKVSVYGKGESQITKSQDLDTDNEEDIIDRQFRRLRKGERMSSRSSRSDLNSPLNDTKNFLLDDADNLDDQVLDLITRKTKAVGRPSHLKSNEKTRIASANIKNRDQFKGLPMARHLVSSVNDNPLLKGVNFY